MTKVEYLEHVQEALAFPPDGVGRDPTFLLYATADQCRLLESAHAMYVNMVALILQIGLPQGPDESGGPGDRPDKKGCSSEPFKPSPPTDLQAFPYKLRELRRYDISAWTQAP